MRAKRQKPLFFHNDCGCIVDYEELEKAMIWMAKNTLHSKRKIFMLGNYPAISIDGNKYHVHRLLMCYWMGELLPSSTYVHHKNHNPMDSMRSNLEIMGSSEHQSMHNKGKVLSKEHREKIAENNKLRKGIRHKYVHNISSLEVIKMRNDGMSISEIATHFNCCVNTIKRRIKDAHQ